MASWVSTERGRRIASHHRSDQAHCEGTLRSLGPDDAGASCWLGVTALGPAAEAGFVIIKSHEVGGTTSPRRSTRISHLPSASHHWRSNDQTTHQLGLNLRTRDRLFPRRGRWRLGVCVRRSRSVHFPLGIPCNTLGYRAGKPHDSPPKQQSEHLAVLHDPDLDFPLGKTHQL